MPFRSGLGDVVTPDERLAALRHADLDGIPSKIVLFWGHRRERDGRVGRGCFSQWWPASLVIDGETYPTAEHWMMASKARLFEDRDALERVLATGNPGSAKAAGRTVKGFDEQVWAAERYRIVLAGTRAKFSQHAELRDVLYRTGDQLIAEASPLDRVWGIGLAADHPDAQHPSLWQGLNLLGFALMDVRDELRQRDT